MKFFEKKEPEQIAKQGDTIWVKTNLEDRTSFDLHFRIYSHATDLQASEICKIALATADGIKRAGYSVRVDIESTITRMIT